MQFNCLDCGEPFATIAKLGLHRHLAHGAPTLNAKDQEIVSNLRIGAYSLTEEMRDAFAKETFFNAPEKSKVALYESPPTVSCPFCGQTYLLSLKAFPRYTETKDYLRLVVDCFECECGATYAREYDE